MRPILFKVIYITKFGADKPSPIRAEAIVSGVDLAAHAVLADHRHRSVLTADAQLLRLREIQRIAHGLQFADPLMRAHV